MIRLYVTLLSSIYTCRDSQYETVKEARIEEAVANARKEDATKAANAKQTRLGAKKKRTL